MRRVAHGFARGGDHLVERGQPRPIGHRAAIAGARRIHAREEGGGLLVQQLGPLLRGARFVDGRERGGVRRRSHSRDGILHGRRRGRCRGAGARQRVLAGGKAAQHGAAGYEQQPSSDLQHPPGRSRRTRFGSGGCSGRRRQLGGNGVPARERQAERFAFSLGHGHERTVGLAFVRTRVTRGQVPGLHRRGRVVGELGEAFSREVQHVPRCWSEMCGVQVHRSCVPAGRGVWRVP